MSSHSEPYANGFGILAGILILWIGTLAVVFAASSLFNILELLEGKEAGDEESRAGSKMVDVASAEPRAAYRLITLSHAVSPSDLPGVTKI